MQRQCNNAGGAPPVTLAEFTLQGDGGKDFYDVSNVDGFNVPISITPLGKPGCPSTTCKTNINSLCPRALQTKLPNGKVLGCKSACLAFGTDRYCCTGSYANPNTCKSTVYSRIFKKACPQAYSYAYDDGTSTFTCIGANYLITFCPWGRGGLCGRMVRAAQLNIWSRFCSLRMILWHLYYVYFLFTLRIFVHCTKQWIMDSGSKVVLSQNWYAEVFPWKLY